MRCLNTYYGFVEVSLHVGILNCNFGDLLIIFINEKL